MDLKKAKEIIKKVKESSTKRNFSQTFEIIITLKDIDIKKTENQLDFYVNLHYSKGKTAKICALVGPELQDDATKNCDLVITQDEFPKFAGNKKEIKKLANEYDFFIAQANIMANLATVFGRVFGPRGKMPNPKAGCVVPPKSNLKPLVDKLRKSVRLSTKLVPMIQCPIGNESMPDEEIADNIVTVYDQAIHHLPNEENNVRAVYVKLTMGKPVKAD